MKVSERYYDEVFAFSGQWDMPSKCGLKVIDYSGKKVILVTELYHDNPGTSVTYAGGSLAKQICEKKGFSKSEIIYIECSPDTNSKLSFYDEKFYHVLFDESKNDFNILEYNQLSNEEIMNYFPDVLLI